MADDRIFTLVGRFDDKITPSLAKLSKSISGLTKDFEKLKRNLRPIAKDMAIMAEGANRIGDGFKNQRSSIDTAVRGLTEYRREMGKVASAQQKLSRKVSLPTFDGGTGGGLTRPRGGRGQRPMAPVGDGGMGDGYTIDKGVIAGLATNFITGIFDQISGAVGKSINFVKGAIQERIDDEMGDIQSAGGILSIGKEKKVAWADTYEEAFAIQKKLNGEMANLAAALPGETGDYVANMKQVTDTVMKVAVANGPAMITSMQKFNSSVKTQQDAYVEATKQLAKYTTLGNMGNVGGLPLTQLAEQMINDDKVNIKTLKNKFTALKKNPLVSGALEKYEAEMNKAGAGSADRMSAMFKAFEQAFPVEVLDAMTNSADGIIQGLKSGLLNPDTGLLGLGRAFEVSFEGFDRGKGKKLKETLSVFDVFLGIFKSVGMVLGPIITELPKIINPFKSLVDPLREFYVQAENTISNFKGATKEFGDMKLSLPAFRGSLMAIGKLAKSMGADKGEYQTLEKMLYNKDLDLGGALQQAFKTLFSSKALEKFGKAVGKALGGFMKMLSNLVKGGNEMVNESGLVKGFMSGWKEMGGSKAIADLVKDIIGFLVKAIVGVTAEALITDPIGVGLLATIFIAPVRSAVLNFFKSILSSTQTGLEQGANVANKGKFANMMRGAFSSGLGGGGNRRLSRVRESSQRFFGTSGYSSEIGPTPRGKDGMAIGGGFMKASVQLGKGAKALKGVMGVAKGLGKMVPGGALVGAALSVADAKANGASWGQAAAGGIGTVVGGVVGSAMGPVGTMIGMTAGQMIGTWVGDNLIKTNDTTKLAAEAQAKAADAMNKATTSANERYISDKGKAGLGGVEAISQKFGGGAGLQAMLQNKEYVRQQGLTPEQVKQYGALATNMQSLNTATAATKTAQAAYDQAVKLNTSNQQAAANALKVAQDKQIAIEAKTLAGWEKMSTGSQTKILTAAGAIAAALGTAAGIIKGAATKSELVGTGDTTPGLGKGGRATGASPGARFARRGWDGKAANSMPLHSAIASEMANKPAGSDLVIANSSETIIPAAGGLGSMDGMVNAIYGAAQNTAGAFSAGFQTFSQQVASGQQATVAAINRGTQVSSAQSMAMLAKLSAQNAALMSKIAASPAFMGSAGGMAAMALGGGYGSRGSQIAGQLGTYIKQTGGAPGSIHEHPQHGGVKYKHSPNSYHYKGRAIDIGAYANEQGGVLRRVAQFNAQMGVKPVELLKAGDPGHSDHVHVAYGMGSGNPAFFSDAGAADKWESMMAGKNPIVSSVRARANEMQGGGTVTVNAPITIHQQPGQDSDQLASLVAIKLTQAVNQLRYSSYNV